MTQKVENTPIRRWWDGWLALILISTVTMVALRLWATQWDDDLYILVFLSFFAALTGLALGYSYFSTLVSILISAVYGLFISGWLFGLTVDIDLPWRERIFYFLGWRLRYTTEQFLNGKPVTDPILFLALLSLLIWILGTLSTYLILRKGATWAALLPLGITLLVIGQYDQDLARNMQFLMGFIFLSLLILGRMTFLRFQKQWHSEGIGTPTDTHTDLTKTLVILALALLIIAWAVPVTPRQITRYSQFWDNVSQSWDQFWDEIPDIFTITRSSPSTTAGVFGDTLGLGNGTPSSENIVFTVKLDTDGLSGYRNYWRARSYDTYEDGDWSTRLDLAQDFLFPENFDIRYTTDLGQTERYTFTSDTNRMINLYTTGQPLWVSRPVIKLSQAISSREEDLVALIADPAIISEDTYQVESRVNLPTIIQLRNASQEYPEWLLPYLQLPDDFSEDIASLALDITDIYNNSYDKASAITRYLRQNIEYSRTIPNHPNRVDPMEWFLFDIKTGFCNYYATAQVLMLRSLGIPARIGVGYAQGEYDSETESYIVRRLDSHAWPEVYFVGIGWVIFEPTTAQPTLSLPLGEEKLDDEVLPLLPEDTGIEDRLLEPGGIPTQTLDDIQDERSETGKGLFNLQPKHIVWIMLSLFALGLLAWIFIRYRPPHIKLKIDPLPVVLERTLVKHNKSVPKWLKRWRYRVQMSVPERAYRQLGWSMQIMGQTLNPADTATERAMRLTALLPELEQPARDIINEYYLDRFSHHIINEERAKRTAKKVRNLAVKARFQQLFKLFKKT
ncbi:MAG: transglutaminase domain-containing protein [Chloroflexota bacterium]|nr:transglutaminase domain-containing protein [Chloroflexota bacterium]